MSNTSRSAPQPRPTSSTTSPSGDPECANVIYQFVDWVRETGLNPAPAGGQRLDRFACGHDVGCRSLATCRAPAPRHHDPPLHPHRRPLHAPVRTAPHHHLSHEDGPGRRQSRRECSSPSTARPSRCPSPSAASSKSTWPDGAKPPTPAGTANGSFPGASPATTSEPRASADNSSNAASSPKPQSTPPCSNSPPRSRTRYWPTCSGISATSAARWTALSSRTWGQYAAARRENDLQHPRIMPALNIACPPTVGLAEGADGGRPPVWRCGTRAVPARGAAVISLRRMTLGVGLSLPDGVGRGR